MKEAIILAGGLGTRLRAVVHDVPKPMAPVQGKPFITYLLDQLHFFGFQKVVLSVGYQYQIIQQFLGNQYRDMVLEYAIEKEPLGTGGAIFHALQYTTNDDVLVLNGDSIFLCDIPALIHTHQTKKPMLTMALKEAQQFDRYGTVALNEENRIIDFEEKKWVEKGIFNTGIYILNKELRHRVKVNQKFSFEKDILEQEKNNLLFVGNILNGYFIDIGIPQDYAKANQEMSEKTGILNTPLLAQLLQCDTLFVDRDGVINKQIVGDYVRQWQQFEFQPRVLEAFQILATLFPRIIVVTNQQCIGKNIVSASTIADIHQQMQQQIEAHGGRIDAIFCSPYLEQEKHPDRKPNIGMALKAKAQFQEIDFSKTIMVGDSDTDIQFAKNAGLWSIFIGDKKHSPLADLSFDGLYAMAQYWATYSKH